MKILSNNNRKNKLIRKLKSQVSALHKEKNRVTYKLGELSKQNDKVVDSCISAHRSHQKALLESVKLRLEINNLLDYKAKYYTLIKNIKI